VNLRSGSATRPPGSASPPKHSRAAAPRPERIGPSVLRDLDGGSSASVRKRLVVEARDDVQVRMADIRGAVPDERVTVWCEAFVLSRLRPEEKLVRRLPLLVSEVEGRRTMRDRNDHAASRENVGRVARIASGGVEAEGVLDAYLGSAQLS